MREHCRRVAADGWLGSRLCEPPAKISGTVCWGLRSKDSAPTPATRRFTAGLLLSVIALLSTSCDTAPPADAAAQPVQWRFAIEEPAGSVQDAYAQRFKQLIEERSQGEVEVTVYPYGTLGTSDQLTEQLHMNIVQFAMASPGHLGKLIPEVQVFLLHWIFTDDPEINNRAINHDSALRARLDSLYSRKEMQLLSIFSEGWQVWTTNKAVRHPDDFRGVKIRVMTSPLLLAAYEAYGASPTPLSYGEVYSALQLNMIDGQENPVFAVHEMSFYEVTDWMIFARHAPFITSVVANQGFYQRLSPSHRAMLDEVIDEMHAYILREQQAYNRQRLEIIRRNKPELGIISALTAAERAAFRAASLPVREQFVTMTGDTGRELLELLLEALKRESEHLR